MKLYRWQEECLRKWKENNDHGIVDVITGAGKTVLALAAVEDLHTRLSAAGELLVPQIRKASPPYMTPDCDSISSNSNNHLSGNNSTVSAVQGPESTSLQVRIIVPTVALAGQWKKAIHSFLPADFFSGIRQVGGQGGVSAGSASSGSGSVHAVKPSETAASVSDHSAMLSSLQNNKPDTVHSSRISDSVRASCTIYVINSARYCIARHIRNDMKARSHVLLIADECHHYTSPENRLCFSFLNSEEFRPELYHSLGLSATPEHSPDNSPKEVGDSFSRHDLSASPEHNTGDFTNPAGDNFHYGSQNPYDGQNRNTLSPQDGVLENALGKIIYRYGFHPALRDRRISRFYVYSIALHFNGEELLEYSRLSDNISVLYRQLMKEYPGLKGRAGSSYFFTEVGKLAAEEDDPESLPQLYLNLVYQRAALTRNARARLQCVSDLVRRLPASEKIILFCERIDQAEDVYKMLTTFFAGIALYHSRINASRRRDILRLFRDGECRILITCKALDEGLDVPDASIGIVVSSTGVRRQRVQRLGRILRPSAAKPYALLFYLHVKESSESGLYLSADGQNPVHHNRNAAHTAGNGSYHAADQTPGDRLNDDIQYASGCRLQYYAPEHAFSFPLYEAAGAELLKRYRSALLKELSPSGHVSAPDEDESSSTHSFTRTPEDHKIEQEIRRCLEEGLLLPDWLAPEETPLQPAASSMIEEKSALTRHQKNYLLIMRELNQVMKSI